jgi:sugar lactone lactonase YvrE
MRRILFIFLWIAVILFVGQVIYFVFFSVRAPRYNEGQPLNTLPIAVHIHDISALCQENGNVWIGTEKHGIYRYNIEKKESQPISVLPELQSAKIRCLTVDRQNRLWVGTSCHGLFIRNGEEWKHDDFGAKISVIRISPDGNVFIVSENGLSSYNPAADTWSEVEVRPAEQISSGFWQVSDIAFDSNGNLFAGTTCHGIVRLNRDEAGNYTVSKLISAKRRFGPGSAPNVSPVPLDPCGDGLPSNQINAVLTGSDGTVWAGTAAGLTWSRDNGETWYFIRGRDYGDKMRGLLAGTPYQWKELPRVRFGELLPEDDIPLLLEDTNGILWIGTRSLGCAAMKPDTFYRETLPKSDVPETASVFLEEMAKNTTRFYGTKTDQIVAMTPLPNGSIMLASRSGSFEVMEYPTVPITAKTTVSPEKTESAVKFPKERSFSETKNESKEIAYPFAVFTGDDYVTQREWEGKYGKIYALIGGGTMPHDKLIAFDESLCRIRPFVSFVGNHTRPLERMTLIQSHAHHHHHGHDEEHEEHEAEEHEEKSLTAWSSNGNAVPRTYDGQHLWCEVKLNKPGQYRLSLFFVDPDVIAKKRPRDYLVQIFPEIPVPKIRTPKGDWQELGRRADEWAAAQEPLAVSRVTDFGDGVYKNFELAGAGTYYIKIDKNYSRKVDMCAVFIEHSETKIPDGMPDKTTEQLPDVIP